MNIANAIRHQIAIEQDDATRLKLSLELAWETASIDLKGMAAIVSDVESHMASIHDHPEFELLQSSLMTIQAFLLAKNDQFIDALRLASQASIVFTDHAHIEGQARVLRVIGLIYAYLGQLQESLAANLQGLALTKNYHLSLSEENETPLVFIFLNNIATLYTFLSRSEEALNYYLEALPYVRDTSITSQILIYANIGITYTDLNQMDSALEYLEKALVLTEQESLDPVHLQLCHTGFALAYQKLHDGPAAMMHFEKALAFAIDTGSKLEHLSTLIDISRYLVGETQIELALTYLTQAIPLGEMIQAKELLRTAYQLTATCYEHLQSHELALNAYKSYMAIDKLVVSSELVAQLDSFSTTYQIEKAQKDAEIYRLKNVALKEMNDAIEEKARLLEASHRNMTVLSQIGQEITATLDIETVLKTIYDRLSNLMSLDVFAIALYDAHHMKLDFKLFIAQSKRLPAFEVKLDEMNESYAATCIHERRGILINDLDPSTYHFHSAETNIDDRHYPRSLIYHPLSIGNEIIGVMTVQSNHLNAYSAQDLEIVKILASYIAIALNNSRKSDALKAAIEELEVLSTTDPLTGLYNRRYMIQQLEREAIRYKRYLHPFTVLIADIDHFKVVNDTYGHDCGDFVLQQLALDLKEHLRCQDFIARWGGEEFLILLTETDGDAAMQLADRLLATVADTAFKFNEIHLKLTLTIGLACFHNNTTIEDTIKKADRALYEGKRNGRNQCVSG